MSNPNNLVRPPVFPLPPAPAQAPAQAPAPAQANDRENLENLITLIATNTFNNQGRNIIRNLLNPATDFNNVPDQIIRPELRNELNDLDKIPDVVRCLREFSGDPSEFSSWKKSVDRILEIYAPLVGTPKYYGILNVVRNKIRGNADTALESYNTPLDWNSISRCLTLHYADKRDLSTLEYQMTTLIQGNLSVQDYYQSVYKHLSLILNKIGCMEIPREAATLLTANYRDKALDTFIRGLKGDLPRLLGMKEPADLPQALHLCLKLENQNYRTQYATTNQGTYRRQFNQTPPQLPPRRPNPHAHHNVPKIPFYPQLAYLPQIQQRPFQRPVNNFPRYQHPQFNSYPRNIQQTAQPVPPRHLPRPEPMNVDSSTFSRAINYANRPNMRFEYAGKRPAPQSQQVGAPNKIQRNFHIDIENDNDNYQNTIDDYDNNHEQSLTDYMNSLDLNGQDNDSNENDNNGSDYSDIHFLG